MQRYEKKMNYQLFPIISVIQHTIIAIFFNILSFGLKMASSPLGAYEISVTENWKLEMILIFIISVFYVIFVNFFRM